MSKTDLIIVGGGAAGLMAGCVAGELGLKTLILERKHKPGRKVLMCGNSRCNLSTNISTNRMLEMYGEPIHSFLRPALEAFGPSELQRWFGANGLKTVVKRGNKVYPHTERAADVVNMFTDKLREHGVSLACSAPVQSVSQIASGFHVSCSNFETSCKYLLLATGGISYPKTGSVGDGQMFAQTLGHSLEPYRPGLVGFDVSHDVLRGRVGTIYEKVRLALMCKKDLVAETRGNYEISSWGIGGSAVSDASRIIARNNLKDYWFRVRFFEGGGEEVKPLKTRPIKEAMVTVGGVSLQEVNNQTMESTCCGGLFMAGEQLDIDGPTGGYNLQAAFATARLAVSTIGKACGKGRLKPSALPPHKSKRNYAATQKRRRR